MRIPPSDVHDTPAVPATSRRRRRPLLLTALLVAAAGGLAPAAAAGSVLPAPGSTVEFVAPTPQAGVGLTGGQRVKAQASTLGIVRSVEVVVRSDDPSIPPYESRARSAAPMPRQATAELAWNTAALTHNGRYRFEARAETCTTTCATAEALRPGILVANPPAVPTGVAAAFRDKVPVVTWNTGPEADLLGYRVLRFAGDRFSPVGAVEAGKPTSFADGGAPAGVGLSYAVVAVRKSPVTAAPDACGPFGSKCATSGRSPATPMIAIPLVTATTPSDPVPSTPPAAGGTAVVPVAPPAAQPASQLPSAAPAGASRTAAAPGAGRASPVSPGGPALVAGTVGPAAEGPAQEPAAPGAAAPAAPADGRQSAPQASSGGATRALDRAISAADPTATVVTLVLVALGFLGAFKARRLLRSPR